MTLYLDTFNSTYLCLTNQGSHRWRRQPWAQDHLGVLCTSKSFPFLQLGLEEALHACCTTEPRPPRLWPGLLPGLPTSSWLHSRPFVTQLSRMTFSKKQIWSCYCLLYTFLNYNSSLLSQNNKKSDQGLQTLPHLHTLPARPSLGAPALLADPFIYCARTSPAKSPGHHLPSVHTASPIHCTLFLLLGRPQSTQRVTSSGSGLLSTPPTANGKLSLLPIISLPIPLHNRWFTDSVTV